MIADKGSSHQHRYNMLGLKRLPSRNEKFGGDPMAVLVWVCKCKKYKAFEYGKYMDMKDLLEDFKNKIKYRKVETT